MSLLLLFQSSAGLLNLLSCEVQAGHKVRRRGAPQGSHPAGINWLCPWSCFSKLLFTFLLMSWNPCTRNCVCFCSHRVFCSLLWVGCCACVCMSEWQCRKGVCPQRGPLHPPLVVMHRRSPSGTKWTGSTRAMCLSSTLWRAPKNFSELFQRRGGERHRKRGGKKEEERGADVGLTGGVRRGHGEQEEQVEQEELHTKQTEQRAELIPAAGGNFSRTIFWRYL